MLLSRIDRELILYDKELHTATVDGREFTRLTSQQQPVILGWNTINLLEPYSVIIEDEKKLKLIDGILIEGFYHFKQGEGVNLTKQVSFLPKDIIAFIEKLCRR